MLILVWLPHGAGAAPPAAPESEDAATADAEPAGLAYAVEIVGDLDAEIRSLLEMTSQLIALRDRPPATPAALERRIEGDLERFREVLRSEGFYAGSLDHSIALTDEQRTVTIRVVTGDLYLLSDYTIAYVDAPAPDPDPGADLEALDLVLGMPARAPIISAAQDKLLAALKTIGYPLAKVVNRRAMVDHATTTMTVELNVDTGGKAAFGATEIEGLQVVAADYVRQLLPWAEGETYDQRKVEEARIALTQTNLFGSIRFRPAAAIGPDGRLPMTLQLTEREHRTIGAGLSYSTSEGPGGEAFWEHRNIFGRNERLRLSIRAAFLDQSVRASFQKPQFLRPDQSLLGETGLTRNDTEAFREESFRIFAGLERAWSRTWRGSAGVSTEFSNIEDDEGERQFLLYGLPTSVTHDTSDDLLNPTRGHKATLGATPYLSTVDVTEVFLVTELAGSSYLSLDADDRWVLAGRARIGSIIGSQTDRLPASKRFYAGGGGSVRGFEFQSIGPLDDDDDPLGGRSVLEVGGELRARVTEEIGVVPFVEGGIIGDEPFLDFDERFLWAVGLGVRYFTAIGPLRLDVAFPVNGRDRDDTFQFYISLGQAF